MPRQRRRDVRRARARAPRRVREDAEPGDARARRAAVPDLPRRVPRRAGPRADAVLLRRAAVVARAGREAAAAGDRAVGARVGRVHGRREGRPGDARDAQGGRVRRRARLEERARHRSARARAGRPHRRQGLRHGAGAAPDPGARAEDDRRVRPVPHLHPGPERRGADPDQVPEGEPLPPPRPPRRGDPAVRRRAREAPRARGRGARGAAPARRVQPPAPPRRDARAREAARPTTGRSSRTSPSSHG